MSFQLGIDVFLADKAHQDSLQGQRLALLAHPASLTRDFIPTADAIAACEGLNLVACFGPQHGMRGDKQDNMVETPNQLDPKLGIPVFSLYGEVRRPSTEMLDTFDVLLIDIQDVGCRIYTFITTLFYLLEDCAAGGKSVIVLDRPNPAGREIEGFMLEEGQESFVGAASIPMRHGLTLGEAAYWYVANKQLEISLGVVAMQGYYPNSAHGFGWPNSLSWVNPSPNLATLNSARVYSGTVLFEGTTLSEGRGTTRALELFGAPDIDIPQLLLLMHEIAPQWMVGMRFRECWFEPTFHKYHGDLCAGIQLHTDFPAYEASSAKPFRVVLLFLKALRMTMPDYAIWRDFPYEYEFDRLAIDVINGGEKLRHWVDDASSTIDDLENALLIDEANWALQIKEHLLY